MEQADQAGDARTEPGGRHGRRQAGAGGGRTGGTGDGTQLVFGDMRLGGWDLPDLVALGWNGSGEIGGENGLAVLAVGGMEDADLADLFGRQE